MCSTTTRDVFFNKAPPAWLCPLSAAGVAIITAVSHHTRGVRGTSKNGLKHLKPKNISFKLLLRDIWDVYLRYIWCFCMFLCVDFGTRPLSQHNFWNDGHRHFSECLRPEACGFSHLMVLNLALLMDGFFQWFRWHLKASTSGCISIIDLWKCLRLSDWRLLVKLQDLQQIPGEIGKWKMCSSPCQTKSGPCFCLRKWVYKHTYKYECAIMSIKPISHHNLSQYSKDLQSISQDHFCSSSSSSGHGYWN